MADVWSSPCPFFRFLPLPNNVAGGKTMTAPALDIRPLAGAMGAEILGADLSEIDDALFAVIQKAFYEFGAIVIRDQVLTHEEHKRFAARFGKLEVHPIVEGLEGHPEIIKIHKAKGDPATFGVGWHSDNSFTERPSLGSILYAEKIPPYGGDTLFANQHLAYEQLSGGMRRMLDGLNAVHSAKYAYTAPTTREKYEGKTTMAYRHSDAIEKEVLHPVVRTHPVTRRKALYVNPMFTVGIEDMSDEESRPLLDFLFRHTVREDFQCRVRWQPGSVVMWDNRWIQHCALDDCQGFERIHYRITVEGEKPI
jgi:taurine dioxygenase